ncbi:MAG TPA: GNAT family N-acetyltransferase, partial [Thermoleophilaceae bacterium]
MATATELDVRPLATSDPTAAALLTAYAAEMEERFAGREPCRVETVAREYVDPSGAFLVVYDDGEPVACGGIRALPDGTAEVKRMYVVPGARGRGIGALLLDQLEDEARRLGYGRLRLDTGAQLDEAKALYRGAGFHEIDDYNGNSAASHWFEKQLGPGEPAASAPPGWLVWLALGTIYIIWGSTYLAIRVMVETVPPLLGAGFRFLVAGAVFYAFLALRRGTRAVRFTWPELLAAG